MSGSFRYATHLDVPSIVALVESAYRGESSRAGWTTEADLLDGQRVDASMLSEALERSDNLVLLMQDGDAVIACCELRRPSGGRGIARPAASLGMFAVAPGRQGSGLGRRMLEEAERIVRDDWHVDRLEMTVLEPRRELIAWYRRRGYDPTGRSEPFPYGDERFGIPVREDLRFAVLSKDLGPLR